MAVAVVQLVEVEAVEEPFVGVAQVLEAVVQPGAVVQPKEEEEGM